MGSKVDDEGMGRWAREARLWCCARSQKLSQPGLVREQRCGGGVSRGRQGC